MAVKVFDLDAVQEALREAGLDGWLFYDFRGSDPIARKILAIDPARSLTSRRWYYFVPAKGAPRKLVHAIETTSLDDVPGDKAIYLSWQSLADGVRTLLGGAKKIAMQYSPRNEVPYISRVDAGTLESVRELGVDVVSSADLVQLFDARLTEGQIASHRRAGVHLRNLVDEAFGFVGESLRAGKSITEYDVLQFVERRFGELGLENDHSPIVGIDEHAADPHFEVPRTGSSPVVPGKLLLLDIWAKEKRPEGIYADITWCAFIGGEPPKDRIEVFETVRDARDAAIRRADEAFSKGEAICGYELDRAARKVIDDAGYGEYFIHRLGHSIHDQTHGNGANLDDLETHDTRQMLPGTLFSVEPGIYLPGRFGVRSEVDVYHTGSGAEVTGPPHQTALYPIEV